MNSRITIFLNNPIYLFYLFSISNTHELLDGQIILQQFQGTGRGSARRALAGQAQRHKFKSLPSHKASYTSVTPVFLWRDGRWKQQTLCKPEASNASVCSNKRDPVSDKAECRDPHTFVLRLHARLSSHTCTHKDQKIKNTNFLKVSFLFKIYLLCSFLPA